MCIRMLCMTRLTCFIDIILYYIIHLYLWIIQVTTHHVHEPDTFVAIRLAELIPNVNLIL